MSIRVLSFISITVDTKERPTVSTSTPASGRVQLAMNVSNLDESIRFYTDLFGQEPTKIKPGYANWAISEPPLKLILFASDAGATINHLGVEVPSSEDVDRTISRLSQTDLPLDIEKEVACCYAEQDKVWATGPDGERWEYYTVLADAEEMESTSASSCACTDEACGCDATTVPNSKECCTTVA